MGFPSKIGLIAGGGQLPHAVLAGIKDAGADVYVAAVRGFAEPDDFGVDGDSFGIAEFGRLFKTFEREGCDGVCFAGIVTRPDFKTLKPDWGGLKMLPGAIKAAAKGDDALLSFIVAACEKQGLTVVAPQDVCQALLIKRGPLGKHRLPKAALADSEKATEIALAIGALDIGQGAVVNRGLVLAIEAQEGTDAMLDRLVTLPGKVLGTTKSPSGVLAKMIKPGQEARLDLPTIGLATVERALAAHLAAIVVREDEAFVLDRNAVIALADRSGLAIVGLPRE